MLRRRVLVCICTVFLTFEAILLLEQQKHIANEAAKHSKAYAMHQRQSQGLPRRLNDAQPQKSLDKFIFRTYQPTIQTDYLSMHPLSSKLASLYLRNVTLKMVQHKDTLGNLQSENMVVHVIENLSRHSETKLVNDAFSEITTSSFKKFSVENYTNQYYLAVQDKRTKRRRSQLNKLCENRVDGQVRRILINPSKTVSYCVVHKVASTHWLRVFRYLWNDTSQGHVLSPSEVTKMDAHFAVTHKLKDHSLNTDAEKRLIFQTFRFMFTREPYTRLWSVYIDKFVLADNYFWSYHGPKVARLNGIDVLPALKPCYQFTFRHFINYVIATSSDPEHMDDHIAPVHSICNPCIFKPDFLGKLETMKSDNKKVLKLLNVTWETKGKRHTDIVHDEIKTIIDFNYHIVEKMRLLTKCLNPVSLGTRILRAFVLNGYIPEHAEMALSEKLPLPQDKLLAIVWDLYKATNRTAAVVKEQRARLKEQGYMSIPSDLMHKLQKIYLLDFQLFDYRLDPKELFYNTRLG